MGCWLNKLPAGHQQGREPGYQFSDITAINVFLRVTSNFIVQTVLIGLLNTAFNKIIYYCSRVVYLLLLAEEMNFKPGCLPVHSSRRASIRSAIRLLESFSPFLRRALCFLSLT